MDIKLVSIIHYQFLLLIKLIYTIREQQKTFNLLFLLLCLEA